MKLIFATLVMSTSLFSCKKSNELGRGKSTPNIEGEFNIIGGDDYTENPSGYLKGVVRVLNKGMSECSGILVTREYVLTAHHCVVKSSGYNQDPAKLRVNLDRSEAVALKPRNDCPVCYHHATQIAAFFSAATDEIITNSVSFPRPRF